MKIVYFCWGLLGLVMGACLPGPATPDSEAGTRLVATYCGTCHEQPDPRDLDRQTWHEHVLPRMGYMLGVGLDDSVRKELLEPGAAGEAVIQSRLFPSQPVISEREWQALCDWILEKAPNKLEHIPWPKKDTLTGFRLKKPQFRLSPPSTTLVQVGKTGGCYIGDANQQMLYRFSPNLQLEKLAKIGEGSVSLIEQERGLYLTVMGSFSPTDAKLGRLLAIPTMADHQPDIILSELKRPVHTSIGDLTGNGAPDLVVSEFGKWTGGLTWWENRPGQGPIRHILRAQAGATSTYLSDLDEDGRTDILALFAQAREGLFHYRNLGGGKFEETQLLSFPPSYGVSAMEIVDWNADGRLDVLICAGDNADYPAVRKPYHGIYLYQQEASGNFVKSHFWHLPGAYGTETADFDADGDLDIASLAFFPDYELGDSPAFVFWRNTGENVLRPEIWNEAPRQGRWMVMDAGDVDLDGDIDILLGSLMLEVPGDTTRITKWKELGLAFVMWENLLIGE